MSSESMYANLYNQPKRACELHSPQAQRLNYIHLLEFSEMHVASLTTCECYCDYGVIKGIKKRETAGLS